MYKSIVFDLGGVMVDFAPRAYLCLLYTSDAADD